MTARATGKVTLVGAGPGAADLITVRGLQALQSAQVVLYDDLASRELLAEVSAEAEVIYVGKREAQKALAQAEINQLLVERASRGLLVVRLKGGDPFVFGRGGDEALALTAAGVSFEIVPGVTAVVAAPAFAGIPLTHHGLADSFEVWTGHGEGQPQGRTAVVLMGMRRLAENVRRLLDAGHAPNEPAAVVQWGGLARQRTVTATLATIVEAAAGLGSPAVLVVGQVVALRERLGWFERRPLFGRRVLVTRARDQAVETCRLLEQLGAETVALPTIALRPPRDLEPLRRAVRQLAEYDYLILTSANAVEPLRQALGEARLDSRALSGLRLCAIGPGTSQALAGMGLVPELVPADHRAEGILELLGEEALRGKRVLLPRAAVAREILPRTLTERGAQVDLIPVYETGLPDEEVTRAGLALLERGEVDVLTFTSASTAENFAALLGPRLTELCAGKLVVAIGPVTRDACLKVGLQVDVMPARYTLPAMIEALVQHLAGQPQT